MAMIDFATIFSGINVLLLASLLSIYARNYKAIKSKFSLGLILFATFLLVQNAAAMYFQVTMMYYYSEEVAGFAAVLNAIEALALAALLYITWKPEM